LGTIRSTVYSQQKKTFQSHANTIESWKGIKMVAKKSKLDPELKARWVSELRSGKYKQGTGNLKVKADGVCEHCCLGVLCEIIAPEGFNEPEYHGVVMHSFNGGKSKQDMYPNQNKMIEIGLYPSAFKKLAEMNDGDESYDYKKSRRKNVQRHTFKQIADYIEKNL
jgi:hypothetical protein